MHGHTWTVTAWFELSPGADIRCAQASLRIMLGQWDHSVLPDHLAWGEDIARTIGSLAMCVQVDVSRPAEGFHARWIGDRP